MAEKKEMTVRMFYDDMMYDSAHGISWSGTTVGFMSERLRFIYNAEARKIAPLIRDAIASYNGNGGEKEALARAWMKDHGLKVEEESNV